MSEITSREVHLISHPKKLPEVSDFEITQTQLKPLQDQQVLVRNLFMSVDPYMRGRMNEGKSYVPPFELNKAMEGGAVGEVVESRASEFKVGDVVTSNYGWREYFIASPKELHGVSKDIQPLSVYLGTLGMTGMTAWAGLKMVEVKAGDVVYISGAAGAVGSVAGQLAKLKGCRVIGSAGSDEKVAFLLDECGFDAAFNYNTGPVVEQLKAEAPDGIDVYFDNVGGESLEAALAALRLHGRIISCGGISAYNDAKPKPGPSNLFNITVKRLTMKGLIVRDWVDQQDEFEKEVGGYFKAGKLKHKETVVCGIENAVTAFIGLFSGQNIGKMVVQMGADAECHAKDAPVHPQTVAEAVDAWRNEGDPNYEHARIEVMSDSALANHRNYSLLPTDVEGFDSLAELALDLRWSWNHRADEVWRLLNPTHWELTQNPWVVLQTVPRERLERVLADPVFRGKIEILLQSKRETLNTPAWFQKRHADAALSCIAYFSMEFMLSEALPIYSGGLGNVAGDQLKAASDLGVPVVGVGLLYQQGYFRQEIDKEGVQQALYPYNDPGQLPITPLRQPNGDWLRLEIALPGYSVWLRAWQVQVGRVKLYLLDSNDAANFPAHRGITSELYGGGPEMRLKQEMLLGIGGWRLLVALGIQPEVCHLNEGHAAFAVLERARSFMEESGQSFEAALAVTRAGNLFTTHTAVAAGFDRFEPALIEQFLGRYAEQKLHIPLHDLLALGRMNLGDDSEKFNMAFLAIRGSGAVNGVSRLHGQVSRHLFEPLFPQWPAAEVPVGHVTNGVHMPSWDSAEADDLWTKACGKDRWLGMAQTLEEDMRRVSAESFWEFRMTARKALVEFTRERLSRQLAGSGAEPDAVDAAKKLFDPNVLTLGFARRFATYKRPNLLLQDPERLLRLLTNPQRPVQLILAGKAHPADEAGRALIQEWIHFIRRPEVRAHVVFLSDYDMHLTEHLVHGVDVWLNTPQRPWEACGTSGMKVLVNGGINLSELDGWWAEAYAPELGWAIGDGQEHGYDPGLDKAEAEMLYETLERQVVPEFYDRDDNGIPMAWVGRIRESMAQLTPRFSADRAVREYTEQHYLPAAIRFNERKTDKGAHGQRMVEWQRMLDEKWGTFRFGEMKVETSNEQHAFEVQVYLNEADPKAVCVELYAEGIEGRDAERLVMECVHPLAGAPGGYLYRATVAVGRAAGDYTARIIPRYEGVSIPLENARILWQR